jgi:pSer/pThr/pTyr-binding forkhead associated (FHA) protein
MGQAIEIGRSSDLDMVLVEDMVSRKHARISAENGTLQIEDFGSTNGTFVNGKKIDESTLEEGDRILIGTSIIKLVQKDPDADEVETIEQDEPTEAEQQAIANAGASGDNEPAKAGPTATHHSDSGPATDRRSSGGATLTGSISGLIEEVPLTDLLQLFSTSQKSGVLVVNHFDDVGKIYLRDGRVFFATINDDDDIASRKAFFRMLSWEEGTFSLEQAGDVSFEDEIDESIENLLMEGMRQLDEMRNLGDNVPGMQERMDINKPLVPPLRDLSEELLDTFQLVLNYEKVGTILNKSLASDLDTMEDIVHLMEEDYISVHE